ncbi:MAG: hypothetical protein IJP29_04415 [Lachnospiraceae bacterium]|nr:hypothetical protein [Lachnospiraceae bacterium]
MKNIIKVVILLIVSLFSVTAYGCNENRSFLTQNDYMLGCNMVKYNLHGNSDFGFNVNFIYKDKNIDVTFVEFIGEGLDGLSVEMKDDTFDEIKGKKFAGYYVKLIGFVCHTQSEKIKIDGVKLKIDEVEQCFEFNEPIVHQLKDEEVDNVIYLLNYPLYISTASYSDTEYELLYYTEQDIIVEDIDFNNYLVFKDAQVLLNGECIGNLEDAFPLKVPCNSELLVQCKFGFNDMLVYTDYDSVYCDYSLMYTVESNNHVKSLTNTLVSQSISNEEDVIPMVQLMTNKN